MKVRHPEKINNPINPIKKKPDWIRTKIVDTQNFFKTKEIINRKKIYTVCQEANCPNISECWSKKHATFMIMGDTCTRACAFCDVKTGKPSSLDPLEAFKVSSDTIEQFVKLVNAPDEFKSDLSDYPGWLEFGSCGIETEVKHSGTTVRQPKSGMALMFPSYFFHGTIPFEGDGERIGIAFDVYAKD